MSHDGPIGSGAWMGQDFGVAESWAESWDEAIRDLLILWEASDTLARSFSNGEISFS